MRRTLSLTLAALAAAAVVLAPAALAKRKHCMPGSHAQEYCQSDPGHHGHGHWPRWHGHGGRDDARRVGVSGA